VAGQPKVHGPMDSTRPAVSKDNLPAGASGWQVVFHRLAPSSLCLAAIALPLCLGSASGTILLMTMVSMDGGI